MAFSLRKMLSNITYFKKPGEEDVLDYEIAQEAVSTKTRKKKSETTRNINISLERTEADSTSRQFATSLKLPESVKSYAAKKGSFSDTDILTLNIDPPTSSREKRKCKKLKVDIQKANNVDSVDNSEGSSNNVENTPKHVLLDSTGDLFSERFKTIDFNKSFDMYNTSEHSTPIEEDDEVISLSEHSDSDISLVSDDNKPSVKMCRKVEAQDSNSSREEHQIMPSTSLESFGDVEFERNEEERLNLLTNYQTRLDRLDSFLKKVLTEFQFHIEVSKVLQYKSIVQNNEQQTVTKNTRTPTPDSWNIVVEKDDEVYKRKLKQQLASMKQSIEEFIHVNLDNNTLEDRKAKRTKQTSEKNKRNKYCNKKSKVFDYPDFRDALLNLFEPESLESTLIILDSPDYNADKCLCRCHGQSPTDSGLTSKSNDVTNLSITSSLGNFTLDTTTLTAYSESLDNISYNSFQDTSLFSSLLQKAAIERITFYIQVHSIQLKCETSDNYESKNQINFHCPSCKITEVEENGLLKHILSQYHCEKLHFLYKTAYIKKCMADGKEIQPSTVLNPMTMYRDMNKIVCFGDAYYACSLCFDNPIVGESVLMAHCSEPEHVERRAKLNEIFE